MGPVSVVDGTDGRIKREAKESHDSSSAAPRIQGTHGHYSPRSPDSRVYFSMLFLPFPNHPCIDASILLYTVCAVHAQPSCSALDIRGTVTPSVRRVMHRTLAPPVCTLQPAQPQRQASRCSPGYLRRPNNRRRLPSSPSAATTWAPRLGSSGCAVRDRAF